MRQAGQQNSEATVIKAAAKGDRNAARSVYETHIGYLTAVCSRYIADDEDVRDLLQESFVRIFRSLDRFQYRGTGSLRAWMTKIVVNDALKYLRDNDRNSMVEFKDSLPEAAEDVEDSDVTGIPPEERGSGERNNLYVFQRLSHKEIADTLGMAPGTSASCLHRARKMLVKMVNEYKHERNV